MKVFDIYTEVISGLNFETRKFLNMSSPQRHTFHITIFFFFTKSIFSCRNGRTGTRNVLFCTGLFDPVAVHVYDIFDVKVFSTHLLLACIPTWA